MSRRGPRSVFGRDWPAVFFLLDFSLGSLVSRVALGLAMVAILVSCGPIDDRAESGADQPMEIADQEDAVCGMLVREQSAPRAQVVHRDGERAFFCSIGDLLVQLSAPSPHGAARSVFVEVMRVDEDPTEPHTTAHEWVDAVDALYVVGIDRPGIMGAPVLVYATRADASAVAAAHPGARVLDYPALRQWWQAAQASR